MFARVLAFSCLVALACPAFAQGANQTVAVSHPVDTTQFFPQIRESLSSRAFSVKQGALIPEPASAPNRLVAGQIFGQSTLFAGERFPGISQSGLTPGDPDISVGFNHIVEVINSQIAFYTKTGTLQLQQSAQTFFAGMGAFNFQFDPKVSYDRFHDRFVLVFLERDTSTGPVSKILVAVSDDGNPNGTWHRYRIEARMNIGGNEYWMDYPGLGYNKDAYVVNGNMFPFSGGSFGGVQFIVMPSAPMLSGGAVTVTSLLHSSGASAQAADTNDPGQADVIAVSRSGNTAVRVYAIQNLTSTPTFTSTLVTVPTNSGPAGDAESTSGRFLDTIDGRVFNAVVRNGRLLTGHTIEGTTFVGCRWYELDLGAWPTSGGVTVVQAGNIQSPTFNYFFPAINKNKTGKVSVLFTRSSTTVTADFMVASRRPGDPSGTVGAPTVMKSSVGNNYTQNRWGDYFAMDVDPTDDVTFWGVHMLIAANNSWWTEILSWTVPGVTAHAPSSYAWVRGVPQSGNLASLAADDNNYLIAKMGEVPNASEPPAQLEVEAFAPSSVVYGIDLSLVAKVNTAGLVQMVEVWNFPLNRWDVVGQQGATTSETVQTLSVSGNVLNYVEPGTHRVKVKFSWIRTGATSMLQWGVSVDQAQMSINGA